MKQVTMKNGKNIIILFFATVFLFGACDLFNYGKLGGADQTAAWYPGEEPFEERMAFLDGVWYSHYAGIGRLDGYRVRKWSLITEEDKIKMRALFPTLDIDNLETSKERDTPQNSDYILLYDGSVYGQQEDGTGGREIGSSGFMGLVRAINIFNNNKNRGAIIIEFFEGVEPRWLTNSQGLAPGEKPFYGIYYRVLSPDLVQLANAVNLAAMYKGEKYYTEKATLQEAIEANGVENEAEFISWGVVIPQDRQK